MNAVAASLVAILALTLSGCATSGAPAPGSDAVGGAMSQPFKDLGVIRQSVPEVLTKASAAPYAVDDPVDCTAVATEVAALDAALGPDLDAAAADKGGVAADVALDALRGALALPFRGIVRRISGAERRDRARVAAVLAGMVRRGYLKGLVRGARCGQGAG